MNKTYTNWWLSVALVVISSPVYSQNYSIHLAAFTQQIELSFFNYAGFNTVQHHQDAFNFHQYSWGNFSTLAAAQNQLAALQQNLLLKGLRNISIKPIAPIFNAPTTDSNLEPISETTNFQIFSRSVHINPSTKSLQKMEVAVLEEVTTILTKYPDLKLRILAIAKKEQPVEVTSTEVVEKFLLAQNIPAYRIKTISNSTNLKPTNPENTSLKNQQVILTLVDLKEEIVLDKFIPSGLIVKQTRNENMLNLLE